MSTPARTACPTCLLLTSLAGLACLAACTEELRDPEIWIDISPVYVGMRSIDPQVGPVHFDLQLTNRGDKELRINRYEVHGDQHCAFTFQGPDRQALQREESAFIRGWYQPLVAADDRIALSIYSNDLTHNPLIVPVCGRGVPPGTTDGGTPPACVVPPATQPDCPQ